MEWLSPKDIQEIYRVSRAQAYKLMKDYIEANGSYIEIGRLKRFPYGEFTEFLKKGTHEKQSILRTS